MSDPLLEVDDLVVHFHTEEGTVRAVDGISYSINEGEAFGLVGESGAGKSVSAMSILQLVQTPPGEYVSGEIRYHGENIFDMSPERLRELRGSDIGMIFQNAEKALNPVHTVGAQIAEAVTVHNSVSEDEAWRRAVDMLERVGIPDPEQRAEEYPHQFSGGMQQRAMIAQALVNEPDMLIADEPTTALDVTIEATILDLLEDLIEDLEMSLLLITHDLSVISEVCDKVGVMYAGRMAEVGRLEDLYDNPKHPYTAGLLDSIPPADEPVEKLSYISGRMPNASNFPSGCRFRSRCPAAMPECKESHPQMREIENRRTACHLYPTPPSTPGLESDGENQQILDLLEINDE